MLATDRCDRCGAQAYALALLEAGELMLCAHHYREHRDALTRVGALVHDETDTLTAPAVERT